MRENKKRKESALTCIFLGSLIGFNIYIHEHVQSVGFCQKIRGITVIIQSSISSQNYTLIKPFINRVQLDYTLISSQNYA